MLLEFIHNEKLAHTSYLVACPQEGSAIVIDPARDITPYLQIAEQHNVRITTIAETHIHADFVSGARELAHATDAQILLSGEGQQDNQYTFPADDNTRFLYDGNTFQIGKLRFTVRHTPGHSPEHLALVMTDAGAEVPYGMFTGDFLFVGSVGRPDLLDKTGRRGSLAMQGARDQFQNIQRLADLPDHLTLFPAHRAGTACGSTLAEMPVSTLGYERQTNPAFQFDEEADFVDWLLADQPKIPAYFAHVKQVNRQGALLLRNLPQAQHIKGKPGDIVPESALFIDTRPSGDFAQKHLPGTINIPIDASGFPTYAGYYVDYDLPTFFIAYSNDVAAVLNALFSIGVDNVPAYFTSEVVEKATGRIRQAAPQDIHNDDTVTLLDVRSQHEYDAEHIPGVKHIHMSEIESHMDELPREDPIAVYCGGGLRSQVVASILKANGFQNVINISGGLNGWKRAGLPTEADDTH